MTSKQSPKRRATKEAPPAITDESAAPAQPSKLAEANGSVADDFEDVFSNLNAIRLSPEEAGTIGTEEVLIQVPVRKPNVNEFVRVSTDPKMTLATTIFIDHEREVYFVAPALRSVMVAGGLKAMVRVLTVNQGGVPFLLALALGDGTGRRNAWHDSAREAAELAKREWIKIVSDMPAGHYRIYRAKGKLPEPAFPTDKTLEELLRLAFRGRVIEDEGHRSEERRVGKD